MVDQPREPVADADDNDALAPLHAWYAAVEPPAIADAVADADPRTQQAAAAAQRLWDAVVPPTGAGARWQGRRSPVGLTTRVRAFPGARRAVAAVLIACLLTATARFGVPSAAGSAQRPPHGPVDAVDRAAVAAVNPRTARPAFQVPPPPRGTVDVRSGSVRLLMVPASPVLESP